MMGKQSGQIQMVILDIDSVIPEDHLLRRIKNADGFVKLILCIEYRITQLLVNIEEDVFKRPAYSGKFLIESRAFVYSWL
jgi:hypothetical protein